MKKASGLGFMMTVKNLGNGSLGKLAGGWMGGLMLTFEIFGDCAGFGDTKS